MEASGQFHNPAALSQGKVPPPPQLPVSAEHEACLNTSEEVYICCPWTHDFAVVQPETVPRHRQRCTAVSPFLNKDSVGSSVSHIPFHF